VVSTLRILKLPKFIKPVFQHKQDEPNLSYQDNSPKIKANALGGLGGGGILDIYSIAV
jgi:hypothetical protein